MARGRVERGVPEGAEQFWSRVGVREHPKGVQRPQRGAERGGGGGRGGPDAHVGVVGQGQVGREGVGQVARGRRVAHHVGVKRRVRRVRPGHGQALPLVLHPAVLEPHLPREGRPQPSPAAPAPAEPPPRGTVPPAGGPFLPMYIWGQSHRSSPLGCCFSFPPPPLRLCRVNSGQSRPLCLLATVLQTGLPGIIGVFFFFFLL